MNAPFPAMRHGLIRSLRGQAAPQALAGQALNLEVGLVSKAIMTCFREQSPQTRPGFARRIP